MKRVALHSVRMRAAIDAIAAALRDGLDPEADPPRSITPTAAGQILTMPASSARYAGVKVVTVTPRHDPRIQGVYLLLDGPTLTPLAMMDGIALTDLRTPAVSAVAVDRLAPPDARRLVVFGKGPQARGHIEAMRQIRDISHVDVLGRGDSAAPVRDADIVCCCTTAREPLFDSALLKDTATVVAIGSHEPDAREVDSALVARATVVVESRRSALREAGDIIQAAGIFSAADGVADRGILPAAGTSTLTSGGAATRGSTPDASGGAATRGRTSGAGARRLANLAELVRGDLTIAPDQPRLFKSTGMAWEDLIVAALAYDTASGLGWP